MFGQPSPFGTLRRMGITFDAPPLAEVSLGCTFLPRPDFLVPHFGAFWERIKKDFPDVAHAGQIVNINDGPLLGDDGIMLPRVWYVSADKARLVQLQQNRFHFNWRKTSDSAAYVRFPAIHAQALGLWDVFGAYVLEATGSAIQPLSNELTYTNIVSSAGKSPFELADDTLRDAAWCRGQRFLDAPTALAHSYTFEVPGNVGDMSVVIATGRRADDGSGVLKIDLTVRGRSGEEQRLGPWALKAHDLLIQAFKDLTTPAMHQHWKLRDVQ